jgi:hypothetical protein
MTFIQKLNSKESFVANLSATYGPETENGYPVELDLSVELNYNDGWRLSIVGGLRIKACEKLGLVPAYTGGQCLDNVVKYLYRCGLVCPTWNSIVPIWREWHLNDMRPGTPKQEACIKAYRKDHPERPWNYEENCQELKKHGLLEDKSYLVHGRPYRYATGHLFREIPHEILLELCILCDRGLEIHRRCK